MIPILFILLCLIVLALVMGPMGRRRPSVAARDSDFASGSKAFEILDQRLTKGEIDRSEYDEKRCTIAQGR
jgi:uncharacterized membrane protein